MDVRELYFEAVYLIVRVIFKWHRENKVGDVVILVLWRIYVKKSFDMFWKGLVDVQSHLIL